MVYPLLTHPPADNQLVLYPSRTSLGTLETQKIVIAGHLSHSAVISTVSVLVDLGADSSFISKSFCELNGIVTRDLTSPIQLYLGTGKQSDSGPITQSTLPLQLNLDGHIETRVFLVTTLSHDIILGIPWLKDHNPSIDWAVGTLHFKSDFCLTNCCITDILSVRSSVPVHRKLYAKV